jgi:hypothetical protein
MRFIALKMATLVAATTGVLLVGAGCDDGNVDGEGEGEGEGECENDRECGGGVICDKSNDGDDIPAADDPFGVCVRVSCLNDDQCEEGEKCDTRRGLCIPENLCDPGDPNACPTAGDKCQYVGGLPVCAPPPAADGCILTPALGYVSAGGTLQLEGVGTAADGKLVPHTTFTWAATNGAVDANGVFTPAAAGDATITGTTANGGATCTATVKVYPAVDAADLRITVIDIATRQPVSGAPVAARIAGNNEEGTTAADGSFTFAGGAAAESVSAFPANHQWHTLIDPPNDVIVYTATTVNADFVDGVKGAFNFDKVKTRGDIKLGIAGGGINAAITDLNFNTIIGEFVQTTIEISGITDGPTEVELPEGLIIGLGQEDFKGQYAALSDKAGPGIAWALAGRVPLSKVGSIISTVSGGGEDLDFGAILGAVLPFFATFDHAVVTGLDFSPAARAAGDANFENLDIAPDTLMAMSAEYTMPRLPCAPGAFGGAGCDQDIFLLTEGSGDAETVTVVATCPDPLPAGATCEPTAPFTSGAVLLSGVIVPGQGLIPLGLSAGLDVVENGEDPDGVMAQSGDNAPPAGTVLLDYAPPHDGIEGNLYVTVAIALDLNQITSTDDLGASIITKVSRRLDTTGNAFTGGFLESQGGTFVPGNSLTVAKKGTADFYRVNFDDDGELEWNVWFEGAGADPAIDIATLAQHGDVDVSPRTVHADVQAFQLGTGYDGLSPESFEELFAFNGTNLDNLLYYLGGWSSESCKANGLCNESLPD